MKTIGINVFADLVNKCLANPIFFSGKSIVLWNASIDPAGIAHRIIEQCCLNYNKKTLDKRWFTVIDCPFQDYDITNIKAYNASFNCFSSGILEATGCLPADLNDWVDFVNKRQNRKGNLSKGWVLIAFADEKTYGNLKEQSFSANCDVYSIKPTLKEWEDWVRQYYDPKIIDPILAYINAKKPLVSLDQWMTFLHNLDLEMEVNNYEIIKDIPEKSFSLIHGGPSFNRLTAGFWEFIQSN